MKPTCSHAITIIADAWRERKKRCAGIESGNAKVRSVRFLFLPLSPLNGSKGPTSCPYFNTTKELASVVGTLAKSRNLASQRREKAARELKLGSAVGVAIPLVWNRKRARF